MRFKKMPTTAALSIFSWLLICAGIVTAGYAVISSPKNLNSWFIGTLALFTSLLCSVIVRVIGNMAQMMFDLNRFIINPNSAVLIEVKDVVGKCAAMVESMRQFQETAFTLQETVAQIKENNQMRFEQLTCDSKDINQNISDIKQFFGQIEKHLDLNK